MRPSGHMHDPLGSAVPPTDLQDNVRSTEFELTDEFVAISMRISNSNQKNLHYLNMHEIGICPIDYFGII